MAIAAEALEGGAGAADVSTPEGLADTFKRNPALARRNPELARRLTVKAAKPATARRSGGGGIMSQAGPLTRSVAGAARTGVGAVESAASQTHGAVTGIAKTGVAPIAVRLIVAGVAALIALEVASYLSGRYFTYNLKQGVAKASDAGTYLGLYPGQQAKLAAQASPPAPVNSPGQIVPIPGVAGLTS